MVVIGVTGGIGSGKGLATEFFRGQGAAVVDADEVASELTEPGQPLVERIASAFGEEFLDQHGNLRRRALAEAVFGDAEAVARLNAVAHPVIRAEVERRIAELKERGEAGVICLAAPLLLEAGWDDIVDRILVLVADRDERVRRVMERDGLTAEQVERRIAAQMSLERQRQRADWVVDTTAGREDALAQLERIWRELNA